MREVLGATNAVSLRRERAEENSFPGERELRLRKLDETAGTLRATAACLKV
jgi:hypothetical protein